MQSEDMARKICPLAYAKLVAAEKDLADSECFREECACYVKFVKRELVGLGNYEYRYEGCGLIAHIPWKLVKREAEKWALSRLR